MLIKTDLKLQNVLTNPLPVGHYKCSRCRICHAAWEGRKFNNNITIKLKSFSTCATEGVVYLWKCPCPQFFIGKTVRCVRTRIQEHLSRIRLHNLEALIVDHYIRTNNKEDDFQFTVLHVSASKGTQLELELLKSEAFWICKLDTIQPRGLSAAVDMSCFL